MTDTRDMTEHLEFGKTILDAQPFSLLVGAELIEFEPGRATIRIAIADKHKQQHGFVHGGVLSYAADNALTFAGGSTLGAAVVTSEYKINYVRPATGDTLLAKASVVHTGKNQAVCRCDIYTVDAQGERLCATAQGTISRLGDGAADKP